MASPMRRDRGDEGGNLLFNAPYAARRQPGRIEPEQHQLRAPNRRQAEAEDGRHGDRSRPEASTSTSGDSAGSGTHKDLLGTKSAKGPLPGGGPARPNADGRTVSNGADDVESLPLPVLDSSSSSSTPKRVSSQHPSLLRNNQVVRFGQRVARFLQGPSPPQRMPYIGDSLALSVTLPHYGHLSINPDAWFTRVYLTRFRRHFPPGSYRLGALLFVFLAAWLVGFAFLVRLNSFQSATEPNDGSGVTFLNCIDTFAGARNSCGLDFIGVRDPTCGAPLHMIVLTLASERARSAPTLAI